MTKKKDVSDDIGIDDEGRVVAIGELAADMERHIIDHPDAIPVLMVAVLGEDVGIRVFGKPSLAVADLLDRLAHDYRRALEATAVASARKPS